LEEARLMELLVDEELDKERFFHDRESEDRLVGRI